MSETTTDISFHGHAEDEAYGVESAIVRAFEAALESREDANMDTPAAAFSAVEDAARDINGSRNYINGEWAMDEPGERASMSTLDNTARDAANSLVEQWGTLTEGAETARVESGRDGVRVIITRA